jgi:hypothetical protein
MTGAMPIVIPITVNMLRILFLSRATKGTGFLYIRDEVSDHIWNTLAGKGWHDPELRAQGFQQFGTSSVACLWGFRAAIQFANQIGVDSIERRHRQLAGYMLGEIAKRGIESWTSPNPIMRCAIVTVNVPPIQRMQLEDWMWKKSPCLCIRFFPMLYQSGENSVPTRSQTIGSLPAGVTGEGCPTGYRRSCASMFDRLRSELVSRNAADGTRFAIRIRLC